MSVHALERSGDTLADVAASYTRTELLANGFPGYSPGTLAKVLDGVVGTTFTADQVDALLAAYTKGQTAMVAVGALDAATYGLLAAGTGAQNVAAVATAFNAAISAKRGLKLPPGDFTIDNSAGPVRWNSDWGDLTGSGKRTILRFTSAANDGLVLGPGAGVGDDLGDGGRFGNFRILGPGRPTLGTSVGKAGLVLDHLRFATMLPLSVDGFDVGGDMRGNCYGSEWQRPILGRYGTCNLGLRLRTGIESGDDIHLWNLWGGGAVGTVLVESDAGDGTAGFYFHGGQFTGGAGDPGADQLNYGAVMVGRRWEDIVSGTATPTAQGEPRQVVFYGGDFEAVIRRHNVKCFGPCDVQFYATRFDNNGSGGAGGTAPLTLLSHSNPYNDGIIFEDCFVGGILKTALIQYTPNAGANPTLMERGSRGQPVVNGVGTNLHARGIFDRVGLTRGIAEAGDVLMLKGLRLRNNAGTLEKSTDGTTFAAVGAAAKKVRVWRSGDQVLSDSSPAAINITNGDGNDDSALLVVDLTADTITVTAAVTIEIFYDVRMTGGNAGDRMVLPAVGGDYNAARGGVQRVYSPGGTAETRLSGRTPRIAVAANAVVRVDAWASGGAGATVKGASVAETGWGIIVHG